MAGKSSQGFGGSLLVILYAAGIVVIGAHEIQRRHGSLYSYVQKESSRAFSNLKIPESWRRGKIGFEVGSDKPQTVRRGPAAEKLDLPEVRLAPKTDKKTKELDQLSRSDRRELDSLIDAVAR